MKTELHTEIIREVLNISNIDVLESIKKLITKTNINSEYELNDFEKKLLKERKLSSQMYDNDTVFEEVEQLLQ